VRLRFFGAVSFNILKKNFSHHPRIFLLYTNNVVYQGCDTRKTLLQSTSNI